MSGRQRQRVAARRVSYGSPDSQHPRVSVAVTGDRPAMGVTLAKRVAGSEDTSPTGSVEFLVSDWRTLKRTNLAVTGERWKAPIIT